MSPLPKSDPGSPHLIGHIDPWFICAALLAIIPLELLLQPGAPHTADGQVHLLRTLEVASLLRQGVFYPRWAPDFYLGYGYPFFNFYAPGAHMLSAWLAAAGLGVARAVVAVQIIALFLYPTGAYLAARSILPGGRRWAVAGPAGLLGAALYLYAPLRFRELFVQGNLSQWLALALLPWAAWLLAGVARRGGYLRAAGAAFVLAALLYAHHPTAFLGWPSLAVYATALVLIASGPSVRARLLAIAGTFALALALGAPFWLPSVVELRDANLNAIATGSFNIRLNLLSLGELLALPAVQDRTALNPPMPNSLGIAQALLALAGLAVGLLWSFAGRSRQVLSGADPYEPGGAASGEEQPATAGDAWTRRQAGLSLLIAAALLLASLTLMLPQAARIWEILPLARFIAFPWRLLGPALLWASLLGSAAIFLVPGRLRVPALALALVLLLLAVGPYLFPRPFGPVPEPALADITRYEMAGGALATASANEYLPRWVRDARVPQGLAGDYLAGRAPARLDAASLPDGSRVVAASDGGLEDRLSVDLTGPGVLRLNRFYFPGWRAWVDGQPVTVTPGGPYGLIDVAVPAGHHELRVAFGNTPVRLAGSLLAALGLLAAVALGLRRQHAHRPAAAAPVPRVPALHDHRPAFAVGGLFLMLAVFKIAMADPHTFWFRQQSPADAPAGMQHAVGARFTNGVELLGYSLSRPEARQGDSLDVRLYWRAVEPDPANARPFLHLDARTGEVTWANQTKLNAGDKPMASWPQGFFVVDDYRLDVPTDAPPVLASLRAGLLDTHGEVVPLESGPDVAALGEVRIGERSPLVASGLPNHDHPYRLGPAVRLAGYRLQGDTGASSLDVTLYWQAVAAVPADYTVFLHLKDGRGQPLPGADGPPVGGWYPSSAWAVGQIIADRHVIPLPAGTRPEDVQVTTGLYAATDGQRVTVTDDQGVRVAGDEIPLR